MTAAVTDFNQFAGLRAQAKTDDPEVLREVAGQFEALFVQTMLKGMRDASLGDPIFGNSDQHEMYQEMLDKQYALEMSGGKGIGLADMLVQQLGGSRIVNSDVETKQMNHSGQVGTIPTDRSVGNIGAVPVMDNAGRVGAVSKLNSTGKVGAITATSRAGQIGTISTWSEPQQFVEDIWPHAQEAASRLKVAPEGLLAQAALETGWGKHVMQKSDGDSSFNLFGIKATGNWEGPTATKPTIEFRDGVSERQVARFRAYPDIKSTFDDYVQVVGSQPRYDQVRNHGDDTAAFATALQDAGYATDPAYAEKITSIINGETMREALANLKSKESMPIVEAK